MSRKAADARLNPNAQRWLIRDLSTLGALCNGLGVAVSASEVAQGCRLGISGFDLHLISMHCMPSITTLILPGLFNSGPDHWQSHWERADATCRRVEQTDWSTPRCADWVDTLDRAVADLAGAAVLVAHSAACALVAHWAQAASPAHVMRVRGALLVAPSDPGGPNFPPGPTGFAPMPLRRLPFRTTVVASADDPYVPLEQAGVYAAAWGGTLVDIGAAGHINSASGLEAWPAGFALLEQLRAGLEASPRTR